MSTGQVGINGGREGRTTESPVRPENVTDCVLEKVLVAKTRANVPYTEDERGFCVSLGYLLVSQMSFDWYR